MNGMRIWTIATVVVIGAILGLGWLIGVSPLLAQAAASEQERVTVEATNAAQAATLAQMKSEFDNIDELQDDLELLHTSIPSTVDSNVVYALLAEYQTSSGAVPALISLGEAIQYGVPAPGPDATTEDTPVSGAAPSGALASSLYQVPVSITFSQTSLESVMAFVSAMQHGPRLFLITSVSSTLETSTITGYLFVIHDGTTPVAEVADGGTPAPVVTPAPTETAVSDPSGSASPTPTPTSTTGP